ncbi:outer membrane chaperone Skp/OmpH [Candidatus Vecturithrix granuli]|uniref:Outer membrane chaperone Skp/OmpH n=1 Tax=Vecturithrix granuli TaxID=1499967 RepID=A0A081C060_VECG1|nr:outer membrane chaperone Skp/OmpH [Candidatus Vecturithrix granuli]
MKKMMVWSTVLFLFVSLMSIGMSKDTFAQTGEYKIGFVDLQLVIDSSEEGSRAQEQMKQKADELAVQAKAMKDDIQKMKDDYDKQSLALTPEARTEKRDEIAKKELDYNRFVKDSQSELRLIEQRALKQLLEDVGRVVVEYGKTNNYTVIFEAGNILYGSSAIELTEEIIKAYNSRNQ